MREIIQILIIWTIAFVPILIWAYIFSYLDNSKLSSHRFLAWIFAGWISVVPVLYLEQILKIIWLSNFNIINSIAIENFIPVNISISLIITIGVVAIFSLLAWLLFLDNISKIIKTYLKNALILCLFTILFLVVYYLVKDVWILSWVIKNPVNIWKVVFDTTWLILLYYIIVWLLEESSKHFNFMPSSLVDADNIQKWVLYAIFIALWFWFIENILYLFNITVHSWYSGDFFSTWIFRWIFSLFVHILCSSIVAFGFMKIYLEWKWFGGSNLKYIRAFLMAFIFSIIVHAIYDISLTLGFSMIIFIYLIFGYLYLTRIFYKEN